MVQIPASEIQYSQTYAVQVYSLNFLGVSVQLMEFHVFLITWYCIVSHLASNQAQYANWTCNHWSAYTTGVCYQESADVHYFLECNGTDAMNIYVFTNTTCNADVTDSAFVVTYKEADDDSDLLECGKEEACNYTIIRNFDNETCDGDSYFDNPYITQECYTSTDSYRLGCHGITLEIETFPNSRDCTGSSEIVQAKYDANFTSVFDACETVRIYIYMYIVYLLL